MQWVLLCMVLFCFSGSRTLPLLNQSLLLKEPSFTDLERERASSWNVFSLALCSWTSNRSRALVFNQLGDIDEKFENEDTLVSEFIRSYFGFRHSFLGVVAAMVVIFPLLFAFLFALSIKTINF